MGKRAATGGFDPSGIDSDAWEELEGQLEATIPNYDRVNRLMTFGQDKVWRKNVRGHAEHGMKVLEVGCGPGSFAEDITDVDLTCLDPSPEMLKVAKKRVDAARNSRGEPPADYVQAIAESIPLPDNTYDFYTISFGLRNTKNLNKALSEAYRVLKPGGRYLCLEFSKIQNSNLDFIYKNYSKLIPIIGEFVVGEKEPYEYLVKSIEQFINQEELIDLMKKNNFHKCTYRNFSGGIVSIHTGWKL